MLLRLRGPDGTFRITVDHSDTFDHLGRQLLKNLPDTVDPKTVSLANAPSGGEAKLLRDIAQFKVGQVGFR
jgi:nuclear protein localization protein 4 homolog